MHLCEFTEPSRCACDAFWTNSRWRLSLSMILNVFTFVPTTAAREGLAEITVLIDGWEAARVIQVATQGNLWGLRRANKGWTTLSGLKLHRVIQALPSHLKCELLLRGRTVGF